MSGRPPGAAHTSKIDDSLSDPGLILPPPQLPQRPAKAWPGSMPLVSYAAMSSLLLSGARVPALAAMSSRSAPGSSSDGAQGPVARSDGAAEPVATVTAVAAYLPEHATKCRRRDVGRKTANKFLQRIREEATGEVKLGRKEAKHHYDLTDVERLRLARLDPRTVVWQ